MQLWMHPEPSGQNSPSAGIDLASESEPSWPESSAVETELDAADPGEE
jgi:hypothetical protein